MTEDFAGFVQLLRGVSDHPKPVEPAPPYGDVAVDDGAQLPPFDALILEAAGLDLGEIIAVRVGGAAGPDMIPFD